MKSLHVILNLVVVGIGLYMIGAYLTTALPPILSGIAFVVLGVKGLLNSSS